MDLIIRIYDIMVATTV